jgi:hypothetical protein
MYILGGSVIQSELVLGLNHVIVVWIKKKIILNYRLQHLIAYHSLPLREILSYPPTTGRAKAGALYMIPHVVRMRKKISSILVVYFRSVSSCATAGCLASQLELLPLPTESWDALLVCTLFEVLLWCLSLRVLRDFGPRGIQPTTPVCP